MPRSHPDDPDDPDTLRAALSDAVKRAGLYEVADAMVAAILDGTFADATEDQVRHAVYELVAKSAITPDPDDQGDADAPVGRLDVDLLAEAWGQTDDQVTLAEIRAAGSISRAHAVKLAAAYNLIAAATSSADAGAGGLAGEVVAAYDAYIEASAGRGHEGEHDRLICPSASEHAAGFHIGQDCCSACGGARYGTEDGLRQAVDVLRAARLPAAEGSE